MNSLWLLYKQSGYENLETRTIHINRITIQSSKHLEIQNNHGYYFKYKLVKIRCIYTERCKLETSLKFLSQQGHVIFS